MQQHLKKLLILIPLVLIAGASFAAYNFAGPTSSPTGGNTDGPLDIGTSNQLKNGGLSVDTFQARTGAAFAPAQQVTFTGLVNGGTANTSTSTINFGDSSHAVSINNIGNATVNGTIQSDSIKSGGGNKPVCADQNGTIYICGQSASTGNTTSPIYLHATYLTGADGNTYVEATFSEPTNTDEFMTIDAAASGGSNSNAMNWLKNLFVAEAKPAGVCPFTSTPSQLGGVTIPGGTTTSEALALPQGCDPATTILSFGSYPHQTSGGRPIIVR